MSRLSAARMNAPSHGITKKSKDLGPKARPGRGPWRKGEPLIITQPCRVALNDAIRDKEFGAADHIVKAPHRIIYQRLSKPNLLALLRRIGNGARIPAQKKFWAKDISYLTRV